MTWQVMSNIHIIIEIDLKFIIESQQLSTSYEVCSNNKQILIWFTLFEICWK